MLKAKSKAKPVETCKIIDLVHVAPFSVTTFVRRSGCFKNVTSNAVITEDTTSRFYPEANHGDNYVTSNAVEIILTPAKASKCEKVLSISKPDYGKIPNYICRIKNEVKKENLDALKLHNEREAAKNAKRRLLHVDERNSILEGLKSHWDSVNSEYQLMTHMTVLDTISKLRRKEQYESELSQVEKDIALLQRPEAIYIDLEN